MGTPEASEREFAAFLEAYRADRKAGRERTPEDYARAHPAAADRIREKLAARLAAEEPGTDPETDEGAARATPASAALPQTIGRYRVLDQLGRGGQGSVYLAVDSALHRRVALKVLDRLGARSRTAIERFRREAETASRLNHPGICTVFEAGEHEGVPFIAMRYVDGETLARRISRARDTDLSTVHFSSLSKLPDVDASTVREPPTASAAPAGREEIVAVARIIESVARTLHVAHENGVIHRDIKPGNIMVPPSGPPVVLDFGLAQDLDPEAHAITRTGELFGTPAYMSPEQVAGRVLAVDRRTDVYSLGVTLFEALTLCRPFESPTRDGLYQAILTLPAPDPRRLNPAVPRELATIIATAMEKNQDRRYQTALDLAEDLRRLCDHEPILARPPGAMRRALRWMQRNPLVSGFAAALFLVLLAALAITLSLYGEKTDALRRSNALRLLAESTLTLNSDPALALLLGIEAAEVIASLETNNALIHALDALQPEEWSTAGNRHVALAPQGRWILVADDSGRLALVDTAAGVNSRPLGIQVDNLALIEVDAAGRHCTTVTRDGEATILNMADGRRVRTLAPAEHVAMTSFCNHDEAVMTVTRAGIRLWNAATGDLTLTVEEPGWMIGRAAISPDGRWLALSPVGENVQVCRTEQSPEPLSLGTERPPLTHIKSRACFRPQGDRLVVFWPGDKQAELWATGSWDHVASLSHGTPLMTVVLDDRGERLLTASDGDPVARLWSASSGEPVGPLVGHGAGITAAAFSADGRQAATASKDLTIRVWDVATRSVTAVLSGLQCSPEGLGFSADGQRVISWDAVGSLRIWLPAASGAAPRLTRDEAFRFLPACNPVGDGTARIGADGVLRIEREDPAQALKSVTAETHGRGESNYTRDSFETLPAVFSADGRLVAAVENGVVRIRDARTLAILRSLSEGSGQTFSMTFDEGGHRLAVYSFLSGGMIADLSPGGQDVPVVGWKESHAHPFVALSRDGRRAAVLRTSDGAVKVLDAANGSTVCLLAAGGPDIRYAVFSPDGRRILGFGGNGQVCLWSVDQPDVPPLRLQGHTATVFSGAFDAGGERAVTAAADLTTRVWDLRSGREILTLPSRRTPPMAAIFSTDNRRILTLGAGGTLREWPLDPLGAAKARRPREFTAEERVRHRIDDAR